MFPGFPGHNPSLFPGYGRSPTHSQPHTFLILKSMNFLAELWELFPFHHLFTPPIIASISLWGLFLYLVLDRLKNAIIQLLFRWFNWAERSLYRTPEEYEESRSVRESQNAFYASLVSIFPFLGLGGLCHYGIEWGFGKGWPISLGIISCMMWGIYQLGRIDSQRS